MVFSMPLPLLFVEFAGMATAYASSDALRAYLFECGDDALFAVTLDPTGSNIPQKTCPQGWRRIAEFALGVHEPIPVAIAPERILQAIRSIGYYIWREGKKQ
jgi:hypothetical protein